jgi:hypothetical protein
LVGHTLIDACIQRSRTATILAYPQTHTKCPIPGYNGGWDGSQVQGFYRIASQCACSLIPPRPLFPHGEQGEPPQMWCPDVVCSPLPLRVHG